MFFLKGLIFILWMKKHGMSKKEVIKKVQEIQSNNSSKSKSYRIFWRVLVYEFKNI